MGALIYFEHRSYGGGPEISVIKIFTVVIYEWSKQARALVPNRPFQPSLMFAAKAGAYPRADHLKCALFGYALVP